MSNSVLHLSGSNFENETSKGVVLVDFWAPWCGPCRMLAPVLDTLASELSGKGIKITKVNVDENQELSHKFSIRSIPAVYILKDGEVVDSFVGVKPLDYIRDNLLNKL